MTENSNNPEKLKQYHNIILDLLKSNDTSVECKKNLCKEFSWMSNNSYREAYERLKNNPVLADEAQYALDRMSE